MDDSERNETGSVVCSLQFYSSSVGDGSFASVGMLHRVSRT